MTANDGITVFSERMESGNFFLWGSRNKGQGQSVPAYTLKKLLFMWHRKSFYGTLIEPIQLDLRQGLMITPWMALDYFSAPAASMLTEWRWDSEVVRLQQAACLFRAALEQGWYVPSFQQWQTGDMGWELLLPEIQEQEFQALAAISSTGGIVDLAAWFSSAVNQMLHEEPAARVIWQQLLQEHMLLQPSSERVSAAPASLTAVTADMGQQSWLDQTEWLVAIGWKQDEVPFRTCLQLVEPSEDDNGWKLQIILQDKSDPNLMLETSLLAEPLGRAYPEHWLAFVSPVVSKDMNKFTRILPNLISLEQSGLQSELNDDQAWEFMEEGSLLLMRAGYSVFLPAWWETLKLLKPKLKAKLKSSVGASKQSMFGLQQIVQFDWKIALGDVDLTEEEFIRMAAEKKRFMHIRGRWVQLDPAFLEKVQQAMKQVEKKGLSLRDVLELHFLNLTDEGEGNASHVELADTHSLRMEVELNSHLQKMVKQLDQIDTIPLQEVSAGLDAELRPYQQQGQSWLLFLRKFGLGGCLADDMGLGKTIQFIAYLLAVKESKVNEKGKTNTKALITARNPSLLICPTSVIGNWQKELQRFAPSIQVHLHYGPQRAKGEAFNEAVSSADLVITSYSLAHLDEVELSAISWDCICLDEAQNIKNAYTKQAASIRKLNAKHRIALTGTPIENRLTELWSIFDFINPGYLGSLRGFSHKYANAVEKTNDADLISQVQKLIRPFLLRRLKKDPAIQLDLPDKYEAKIYVPLTAEQGAIYENIVKDLMERVDTLNGMEKKGLILATLTKLKQVCNHSALVTKERGTAVEWLHRSSKVERLLEMIAEIRAEGESCLIFTQFVEMGHLLQMFIEREQQESVQFLHGGVPKAKRDEMIERFQDTALPQEERRHIFILSLKAGGTGLNLTAATHVFHFDRWWNPAVENQATDRAFRIGQTKDVQVHKFVTLGTLEERIDEMIERKMGLSQQIVGGGESWVTEMSTNELKQLLTLRKEWIEG